MDCQVEQRRQTHERLERESILLLKWMIEELKPDNEFDEGKCALELICEACKRGHTR